MPSNSARRDRLTSKYRITAARRRDLPLLPAIELAAATLLKGFAPDALLADTTSLHDLQAAERDGRLWVVLADDVAVGFAHMVDLEPGVAHLQELDVHPEHGRRGLGTRLVETVCRWSLARGDRSVTLTTFRDVPWNMPFYARRGFAVIDPPDLSPALRAVLEKEIREGFDPARRVAMRREHRSRGGESRVSSAARPTSPR